MNARTFVTTAALVLIGLGALNCFFGFKVFRVILLIGGFLLGAALGGSVTTNENTALILAFVGGLLGAFIGYLLYLFQVIIAGALLGALVVAVVFGLLGVGSESLSTLSLVGALIGAVIAFFLRAYIVMLNTAFSGAAQVVYGVLLLIPGRLVFAEGMVMRNVGQINSFTLQTSAAETVVMAIMILVLGTVGFLFQVNTNKDALRPQEE